MVGLVKLALADKCKLSVRSFDTEQTLIYKLEKKTDTKNCHIEIFCKMFAQLKRMHCVGLENRQYCYINRVSKALVSDIHTRQVIYIQGK